MNRTRTYFLFALLVGAISNRTVAQDFDILIRNGKIINGTGNSWFYGDVGIKNGTIRSIGRLQNKTAGKIIDASGLVVAPGFIDVHGHIENSIFERPTADNFLYDGVTTIITGNCGSSADDLAQFFDSLKLTKTSINIASLAGHNTIRKLAVGLTNQPITVALQQKMDSIAEKAMQDGAVGLSTGLIYLPGMYAKTEEIISLAKQVGKYNGVYASHIRSENSNVAEAIEEAINIGRQAGVPVEISHFKVSGKANWGRSTETLDYVKNARKEGLEVTIDQYPYTASSTNLNTQLPDWAVDGGLDSIRVRLSRAETRKKVIEEMIAKTKSNKYRNYEYAVVARYQPDSSLNGKSITEINKLKGRKSNLKSEAETILEMVEAGGAQMIYHSMNEEDVTYIMKYPFSMVGADAGVATGTGMPHPRAYGTNARILSRYVRDKKIITLEEAIRRMTSLAAQKFNLPNRGLIMEGMAADIVVFDPETVTDKSTFEKPHQYSAGFKYVLVNGAITIEAEKHNGTRAGQLLYGPGKI